VDLFHLSTTKACWQIVSDVVDVSTIRKDAIKEGILIFMTVNFVVKDSLAGSDRDKGLDRISH